MSRRALTALRLRRWRQTLEISMPGAGATPLRLINTDAGATAAIVEYFRDSASPAISDILFEESFFGRSSTGVKRQYAGINCVITDPVNTTEDANLRLRTQVAGTLGDRFHIGAGAWTQGATGGDRGANTLNSGNYFLNGTQLPIRKQFTSTDQTITAAGALTLAHGLGVVPVFMTMQLVCTVAELNYSINDVVDGSNSNTVTSVVMDATNLNVRYSTPATNYQLPNKTTGAVAAITLADWKMRFKAFA